MASSSKKFSQSEIDTLKKALLIAKKHLKREGDLNKKNIKQGIVKIKEDFELT